MPKIKHSVATHRRKKRVLKAAKGQFMDRSKQYQQAKRSLLHSMAYAYRDRKNKKRVLRSLWILRINSACRSEGLTYNRFMHGLKKASITIDRQMLSELAISNPESFNKLVAIAKG